MSKSNSHIAIANSDSRNCWEFRLLYYDVDIGWKFKIIVYDDCGLIGANQYASGDDGYLQQKTYIGRVVANGSRGGLTNASVKCEPTDFFKL